MAALPPIWHGTLREHYLVLFAAASSFGLCSAFVGAWIGARFGSRRLRDGGARAATDLQNAEQLARLTQAVDAIALEVERISEGQRFTTRLLSERGTPPVPPRTAHREAPGIITPH